MHGLSVLALSFSSFQMARGMVTGSLWPAGGFWGPKTLETNGGVNLSVLIVFYTHLGSIEVLSRHLYIAMCANVSNTFQNGTDACPILDNVKKHCKNQLLGGARNGYGPFFDSFSLKII